MNFSIQTFRDLDNKQLYEIIRLRNEVFVVEQNCPYQDADGKDYHATHVYCCDDNGRVLAYCRLLPPGVSYKECSIGRVVNAPDQRGKGLGRALMETAIEYIEHTWKYSEIRISAQKYLEAFYGSLGFKTCSEEYLEDGIPHVEMLRVTK
jgi:ElaA protein